MPSYSLPSSFVEDAAPAASSLPSSFVEDSAPAPVQAAPPAPAPVAPLPQLPQLPNPNQSFASRAGAAAGMAWQVANASAIKSLGGKNGMSALDLWEDQGNRAKALIESALGEDWDQTRERFPGAKVGEFLYHASKLLPQLYDFATSPLGAGSLFTGGLPNAVKAGVGAAFGTQMALGTHEAYKRYAANPTPGNAGDLVGSAWGCAPGNPCRGHGRPEPRHGSVHEGAGRRYAGAPPPPPPAPPAAPQVQTPGPAPVATPEEQMFGPVGPVANTPNTPAPAPVPEPVPPVPAPVPPVNSPVVSAPAPAPATDAAAPAASISAVPTTPVTPAPATDSPQSTGLQDLGNAGGAITGNMYDALWARFRRATQPKAAAFRCPSDRESSESEGRNAID